MNGHKWTKSLQKSMNGSLFSRSCVHDKAIINAYNAPEKRVQLKKTLEKLIPSTSMSSKVINNQSLTDVKVLLLDAPEVLTNKISTLVRSMIKEVNQVSNQYYKNNHRHLGSHPFFYFLASNYEICTLERTLIDSFKYNNFKRLFHMITNPDSFANFVYFGQRELNPNVPNTWPNNVASETNAKFVREFIRMANFLIYPGGTKQSNGLAKNSKQLFHDQALLSYKALAYASHIK